METDSLNDNLNAVIAIDGPYACWYGSSQTSVYNHVLTTRHHSLGEPTSGVAGHIRCQLLDCERVGRHTRGENEHSPRTKTAVMFLLKHEATGNDYLFRTILEKHPPLSKFHSIGD